MSELDGGQSALAGFLFQLQATSALVIHFPDQKENQGKSFEAAFEVYGQDASITTTSKKGKQKRALYQFKYSQKSTQYPVRNKELIEIAVTFHKSLQQANKVKPLPTKFVLVTNRAKDGKVKAMLDDAKNGTVNLILNKLSKKKRLAVNEVLKNFDYVQVDNSNVRQQMEKRAKQLGLLKEEIPIGIQRVVVNLFEHAAKGIKTIYRKDLDSLLANIPDVRPLNEPETDNTIRDEIEDSATYLRVPRAVIPRTVFKEFAKTSNHALIFVDGKGGTGKTSLVWQFFREQTDASRSPIPFVASTKSDGISDHWPSDAISSWRGTQLPVFTTESLNNAISRLENAKEGLTPPVLYLALDGLDEISEKNIPSVRRILDFFVKEEKACKLAKRPRATLLITCRKREQVCEDYYRSGFSDDSAPLGGVISVNNFTDQELATLQPGYIEEKVAARIRECAKRQTLTVTQTTMPALSAGILGSKSVGNTVADEIYEALKHPVFWRFFKDSASKKQELILSNDRASVDEVCADYMKWFCKKAQYRQRRISKNRCHAILVAIANATDLTQQPSEFDSGWITPAKTVEQDTINCEALWKEAESSGLIIFDPNQKWHWSHPFLCRYLAAGGVKGGL